MRRPWMLVLFLFGALAILAGVGLAKAQTLRASSVTRKLDAGVVKSAVTAQEMKIHALLLAEIKHKVDRMALDIRSIKTRTAPRNDLL